MNQSQNHFSSNIDTEKQWRSIYFLGGVTTVIALSVISTDINW